MFEGRVIGARGSRDGWSVVQHTQYRVIDLRADKSSAPSRVLSSSRDGSIQVTKERTKNDPTPFTIVRLAEIPNVVDAIISPNGAKLATKSSRGVFEIWDVATLTQSNGN